MIDMRPIGETVLAVERLDDDRVMVFARFAHLYRNALGEEFVELKLGRADLQLITAMVTSD